MSRNLKRVPMNFMWPLHKVWRGYINPFGKLSWKCPECAGTGCNKEGRFLSDSWYRYKAQGMFGPFFGQNILAVWNRERLKHAGWSDEVCDNIEMARRFGFQTLTHWDDKLEQADVDALVKDRRLMDLTHVWDPENKWQPRNPQPKLTPDDVARWSAEGMGHDCINQWVCVRARAARYGVPDIHCAACKGECDIWPDAATKKQYEDWGPEEPPKGDGYQLWEDCSEGSPVSPVFATLDELCAHAEKHCTTFGSQKASAAEWKTMLEQDFVHHKSGNAIFM